MSPDNLPGCTQPHLPMNTGDRHLQLINKCRKWLDGHISAKTLSFQYIECGLSRAKICLNGCNITVPQS